MLLTLKNKFNKRIIGTLIGTFILSSCSMLGSGAKDTTSSSQPHPKPRAIIALALGGGASKGFAHIGVIKVLQANQIPIDIVTGTSAGAIVGSLYASGMNANQLSAEAQLLKSADLIDPVLSTSGFIKGQKLQDYINAKVKNKPIQSLPKKFAAIATEFGTGNMAVLNYGNTGQAVRASASIPNVFQPTIINGKRYVDGGLVAPVPVIAAKQLGANIVLAVDISARPKAINSKGFFSYLDQSLNILSTSALRNELNQANIIISPQVQSLGSVGGFDEKDQAIQLGEEAAKSALPQIRALLSQYQIRGTP